MPAARPVPTPYRTVARDLATVRLRIRYDKPVAEGIVNARRRRSRIGIAVLTADGLARYVTLPAGHQTVVARTTIRGGSVLGSRPLAGRLTIPAVAYDRSASGISADGTTLALIEPRQAFPRRNTRLVVLDARRLRLRRTITLRGDFGFDAISPNGPAGGTSVRVMRGLLLVAAIDTRTFHRERPCGGSK